MWRIIRSVEGLGRRDGVARTRFGLLTGLLLLAAACSTPEASPSPSTSGAPATLSTSTTASPSETAAATPVPAGALSLVDDADLGPGNIAAVANDGTHLVAGGLRCETVPLGSCATALWGTMDGRSWRYLGAMPDGPDYAITALEAGPLGWVAFATNHAWYSPDGLTWQPTDRTPFIDGMADGGPSYQAEGGCCGAEVHDVVATADGYVAVGGVTCFKCRGRAAVWRSTDGRAWQRIPYEEDFEAGQMASVVALPEGRLVAVGAAAWTSDDGGRSWVVHSEAFADGYAGAGLSAGPDGLIAVGHLTEQIQGVVWTSTDGATWQRAVPTELSDVETTASLLDSDLLIVAGQRNVSDGLVVYAQGASGAWSPVLVSPDDLGFVSAITTFGDVLLALGSRRGGLLPPGIWSGESLGR